jgi:hypothetical protein
MHAARCGKMKMSFRPDHDKSTMKNRSSIDKLSGFCLVALLSIFNCLHLPTAACTPPDLTSQSGLRQSLKSLNCCCDSGRCCAEKESGCSATPLSKVLPVTIKLKAARFIPQVPRHSLLTENQLLCKTDTDRNACHLVGQGFQTAKLYLVHRALLI